MKSDERREVLRGHLEECLRHYALNLASQVPKGSKGAAEVKKPLAQFCNISVATVTRWLNVDGQLPVGEQRIKLMCFLELVGYRIIEWQRLPSARQKFAELIGFGVFTGVQAAKQLSYAQPSSLYIVLYGEQSTSDSKDQAMWEIWKRRRQELEEKKARALEKWAPDLLQESSASPQSHAAPQAPGNLARQHIAIVKIMEGLLVMLDEEALDESFCEYIVNCPAATSQKVLRLSARLSNLSSRLLTENKLKGGAQ